MPVNNGCEEHQQEHGNCNGLMEPQAATILVTGGTGLVGMGIKMALEEGKMQQMDNETWIFVGRKEADLTDLEATRALFAKYRPTHVVNLAASVGGLLKNMKANLQFFEQNLAIISNVLKCCHELNVKFCVSCMSTCIYPDKTTYPIDETMLHNGPPHDSNFGYAYAKRMIDILNRGYAQQHGRNYTSAIACSVFGPHDNFSLTDGHVIPALLHKVEMAKRNGTPLEVYGSGRALRQFIYNLDLGKLFIWAVRNYRDSEPILFSVGEEEEMSIADVVKFVAKSMDFEGDVIFDSSKPEGQLKKNASNHKLRKYLPDFKFTPFEIAIQETADWFKQNYEQARR